MYDNDNRYAPVGTVVFSGYWQEHYTVLAIDSEGWVTVRWHGDAKCANPQGVRTTTHLTPFDPHRDKVTGHVNVRHFSAMGDQREHEVRCTTCLRTHTLNISGSCDVCMDRAERTKVGA